MKLNADRMTNDPTGYRDYLLDCAEGKNQYEKIPDSEREKLTWGYYLYNVLGVVEDSQDGPEINQDGKNTRALLYESSGGMLRTYYKGQCYYTWWLRHSNDNNDQTNGVMEYAVVRNNIYKVNVKSVYSIGGDIPEGENIRADVFVKMWTMLDEETLPM